MSTSTLLKNTLKTLTLSLTLISPIIAESPPKHIAITQFVEHVAVDAVREGLLEELAHKGYKNGKNLVVTFENAQGNAAIATQISRKFIGLKPAPDVIVALTTPSAQTIVKAVGRDALPIVFSAVTDPYATGLASSLKDDKNKITGVTDAPPIKEQMAFIKTLLPKAKRIGVLYNPGDNGSTTSMNAIRKAAKAQELLIFESTPTRSSDIQAAILQLVGKVDALYIPLDNMLVSAMQTVASIAIKHNLPLFSADSGSVEAGAFACLGYSYRQMGAETGKMVARIIEGTDPSEIAIASPEHMDIFINRDALQKLNITLPETVREKAHFY